MRLRMVRLKWTLAGALVSAILLSPSLWMTERAFPTVPAFAWLPELPHGLSIALSVLLVGSAVVVAFVPSPGLLAAVPAAIAGVLVLFDVNRLQPWLYQYVLMFAALALVNWRAPESRRSKSAWAVCGLILIGTYLWSGVQKVNLTFAGEVAPWMLQPLGAEWAARLVPYWFVAPAFETSIGVLLLFQKTRMWGLVAAVIMHTSILLLLGPLGRNVNSIVWPWNIWMPLAACVLFVRTDGTVLPQAWSTALGKGIVVLLLVTPALSFVGTWDGFLSSSLYSGTLRDGWIYFTPEGASRLPPAYTSGNPAFVRDGPDRYRMDVTQWSQWALNVPPYAEPRVYVGIVRKLEQAGVPPRQMTLLVRDRQGVLNVARTYSAVSR